MLGDVARHEKLIEAVEKKSLKGIRSALGLEGTDEFKENLVKGLKQSYTNVNTVIQRDDFDGDFTKPEIKNNRLLFKNLLKIAANDGIDLSESRNSIIGTLERDIAVFRKNNKAEVKKDHPLYEMGMKFVEYDEKMERRSNAPTQKANITPESTPKVSKNKPGRGL